MIRVPDLSPSTRRPISGATLLVFALSTPLAAQDPQPRDPRSQEVTAGAPTEGEQAQATAQEQATVSAQPSAGPPISLKKIMSDPDWMGRSPQRPYWSASSATVLFDQKRAGEQLNDLVEIDLEGRVLRTVADDSLGTVEARAAVHNGSRTLGAWIRAGDLFYRTEQGEIRQLTRTAERESSPRFTTDDSIAFRRGNAVVVRNLETGLEWQPVRVTLDESPSEKQKKEALEASYLDRQQERLFEIVREEDRRERLAREREERRQQEDPTRGGRPFYVGKGKKIQRLDLSPSTEHAVLALEPEKPQRGAPGVMPRYVTATGYTEARDVRPRVGTGRSATADVRLLAPGSGEMTTLDLSVLPGITTDPLESLRQAAKEREDERKRKIEGKQQESQESEEGAAESEEQKPKKKKPRGVRLGSILWNDAGSQVVLQLFSHDNKDRWIAAIDLATAELVPLHRITDEAWINWRYRDVGWIPGSDTIWFLSEETGYSHLYTLDVAAALERATQEGDEGDDAGTGNDDGEDSESSEETVESLATQITSGEFVVASPTPSHDGSSFTVRANPEHPGIFEIYRVGVGGGELEQLTALGGLNDYSISPDESLLLVEHSTVTQLPELYLQNNEPGAIARRLTWTISEAFEAISWTRPEIVEVPSTHHDRPIFSRIYRPEGDAAGKRPAVVFVHGAGYLQNAHQGWSNYFREFMFHSLLVRRGYVVLDMDYRASAGYGRDWRTAIYRQMGTPELEDLEDGVRFLVENHSVDPQRVGVYGGSYGGFITLMALFVKPDLFAAGAALRPVTDWAHYNHGYTSNILNTPDIDPEAYERSSPIELADGLESPLLIAAGMLDDNVFFQDSVRLVQRLIELEKTDWEMAMYPIEAHGFREPTSWLDEYRRILELFERHVKPQRPDASAP